MWGYRDVVTGRSTTRGVFEGEFSENRSYDFVGSLVEIDTTGNELDPGDDFTLFKIRHTWNSHHWLSFGDGTVSPGAAAYVGLPPLLHVYEGINLPANPPG